MTFMTHQKERHVNFSEAQTLSLSNLQIKSSNCVRFLGFLLDPHLNFKCHLDYVCSKLLKGIYALSRAAQVLPSSNELKLIYSALILPYLHYGLLSWGGKCKTKTPYYTLDSGDTSNNMIPLSRVHNLQKRALRIVAKSNFLSHHIPLCYSLQLLDLEDIYNVKSLSFFYDYYHGELPPFYVNFLVLYVSRNNELLIKTNYRRTNLAASSLQNTLPNIWNPLPPSTKAYLTCSKPVFLRHIKQYYLEKYKYWTCIDDSCYVCRNASVCH